MHLSQEAVGYVLYQNRMTNKNGKNLEFRRQSILMGNFHLIVMGSPRVEAL